MINELKNELGKIGINEEYLHKVVLSRIDQIINKNDFSYTVTVEPDQYTFRDSNIYYIDITYQNGSPIINLVLKQHKSRKLDPDLYDGRFEKEREEKRNYERDKSLIKFLSRHKGVGYIDSFDQHNAILMEAFDLSLENKILDLYQQFGTDDLNTKNEIKAYISETIKVIDKNFELATEKYLEEKKIIDKAVHLRNKEKIYSLESELKGKDILLFDTYTGVSLVRIPEKEEFLGRLEEYFNALFFFKYVQRLGAGPLIKLDPEQWKKHTYDYERRNELWKNKYLDATMKELKEIEEYFLSKKNNGVINFDTRVNNVLLKEVISENGGGKHRYAITDYPKTCFSKKAIDVSTLVYDRLVIASDFDHSEIKSFFEQAGIDKEGLVYSTIWSILRNCGTYALTEIRQKEKYQQLIERSVLYSNEIAIPSNLRKLEIILEAEKYAEKFQATLKNLKALTSMEEFLGDSAKNHNYFALSDKGKPPKLKEEGTYQQNRVTKKGEKSGDNPSQHSNNPTSEKGKNSYIIRDIRHLRHLRQYTNNHPLKTLTAAALILAAGVSVISYLTGISPLKYYTDYFSNKNKIEIAQPIKPRDQKIEEIIKTAEKNQLHLASDLPMVAERNGKALEKKVLEEKTEEVKSVQEQKPTGTSNSTNSTQPDVKAPQPDPIKEQAPVPVSDQFINDKKPTTHPPPQPADTQPII